MFRWGRLGGDDLAYGGPWTLIKLDVVEAYLNFYFTAMRNQPFKFCYIDAFAGEGEVDVRFFNMSWSYHYG